MAPSPKSEQHAHRGSAAFHIEFVDPLFAVAIHLGFSHNLFAEVWFEEWRLPAGSEIFRLWTFGLCFLTLLLAWLGYHQSIRKRPVRGLGRFLIDVVLVSLYAVLLVKANNFQAVLSLLVIIYSLYVAWSTLKAIEYSEQYAREVAWRQRYASELVTAGWFGGFWVVWFLGRIPGASDGVLLGLCYLLTIGHRINKIVPIWSSLGRALARLFARGLS